jgi:putative (di)nucleoside polyphosphate hydrolase
MPSPHFRAGVVILVRGTDGRYLAFERGDVRGQWQAAQGGMENGETPIDAAWRELREETGLGPEAVCMVAEHPEWLAYEYPAELKRAKGRLGQAHRYFVFEVLHDGVEPTPDGDEFVAWKWVDAEWLVANAVEFRQENYRKVLMAGVGEGPASELASEPT